MPNTETDRLDDMMRKVEGLLAVADNPATPPEAADNYRAQAERIMRKYKIEEEDLLARGELSINAINVLFRTMGVYPSGNEFSNTYEYLVSCAIRHAGCEAVWAGWKDGQRQIEIIGYEADIRYAEALFMSARLTFADRMEPKRDDGLSDMENVYRMRSAGMERIRIAHIMGWEKGGAKVTRLYKQACEQRGEDATLTGKGNDVKQFREAYAEAFWGEFWHRLNLARMAVDNEIGEGGLVLHGRKERIKEAMYERYPYLRPSATPARTGQTPARASRWTKADQRAYERRNTAAARAGRQAGKKAAQEVEIKQGTPKRRLSE